MKIAIGLVQTVVREEDGVAVEGDKVCGMHGGGACGPEY